MQQIFGPRKKASPEEWTRFQSYASFPVLGLIALCATRLFWRLITPRKDFFNELWGPAYLLAHGQSPYDTASLNPNLPAAWFPMAIGFFFPLGWMSEMSAAQIWFLLSILALCGTILLAMGKARTILTSITLALFCFFFPPVLNHLYLGQISIIATFCVALAARFIEHDQPWRAAVVLALAFSKPHLAFLPMLGFCLHYFQRGGWKAVFAFGGKVALLSFAMTIPLFIAEPNWIPDALVSMRSNPFWLYPSLFIVYLRALPGWEWILWGLTLVFILGLGWFLWTRLPLKQATYWSLALAPLASPYIGSWDFVVLLPLLFLAFAEADWRRKIFLACSYLLAWIGMALVQIQPGSDNHFFWWVPLWFTAAIALVTDWKTARSAFP